MTAWPTSAWTRRAGWGINGESGSIATAAGAGGIRQSDPARYGSLQHPGDSHSYGIYQQAGRALHTSGSQLLGGLHPKRVLALGESQSAFRLVTFIDALQPRSPGIYDAYFVYSRGGNSSDLSQSPQATIATPTPTCIRTDLHVPVFLFETETDLLDLGYLAARQPSTPVHPGVGDSGTAHDDTYGLLWPIPTHSSRCSNLRATRSMASSTARRRLNAGSHTYELRAVMAAVNHWIATGAPPRQSPRLEVNPANRHAFLTDRNGNALGGIRTLRCRRQWPRSRVSASRAPSRCRSQPSNASTIFSGTLCGILGTTAPFSEAQLSALYPTHADFVAKWDAATATEVKAGYLLAADARTLDQLAAQSTVGG